MTNTILKDFQNNLVEFLDELIEQFPHETDFILARILIKDQIPREMIMNSFIRKIYPHKEYIINKNEDFFLDSKCDILANLNKNKVNHFKLLWKSSSLDDEDKNVIWAWFQSFINLAEKFQQLKLKHIQKSSQPPPYESDDGEVNNSELKNSELKNSELKNDSDSDSYVEESE